jgi:hypothetical protein
LPNLEFNIYEERILKEKKYGGKVDRLKLYKLMKDEWERTPLIAKKTTTLTSKYNYKEWELKNTTMPKDKTREQYLQRVRNLTRPLSHYTKL